MKIVRLTTRQITTAGLLVSLTVVMAATGIGFIPVPTPAGAATLMHLPVILAGIIEGPIVGALTGLLFGLFTLQFLGDPLVVLPARLLIGVFAWLVYRAFRNRVLGAGLAAAVGSATNTIGTLGLAVLRGYIQAKAAFGIALVQGLPELVVSVVVLVPIALAVAAWKDHAATTVRPTSTVR